MAYELSSMGIRVDEDSLLSQIKIAGCEDRLELDFHKKLLIRNFLIQSAAVSVSQDCVCICLVRLI